MKALLTQIVDIAQKAGEAILEVYHSNTHFDITLKEDNTPVTTADLAAHEVITRELQALTPSYPVLSEESASIPYEERQQWQQYWLVDPLDGTREFIHRTDDFTVNIALITEQKSVLGVVYSPVRAIAYAAATGVGAFKIDETGAWQSIHTRTKPSKMKVVVSRFHNSDRLAQRLAKLGEYDVQTMGSALKPCVIADGEADLYIRLGPTSEWDTAASQCILELAGGALFDLSGQSLCYNSKDSLLNPAFISVGDPKFNWLDYLQF